MKPTKKQIEAADKHAGVFLAHSLALNLLFRQVAMIRAPNEREAFRKRMFEIANETMISTLEDETLHSPEKRDAAIGEIMMIFGQDEPVALN